MDPKRKILNEKLYFLGVGASLTIIAFGFTWWIEPYFHQYGGTHNLTAEKSRVLASLYVAGILIIAGLTGRLVANIFLRARIRIIADNSQKIRLLLTSVPTLVTLFHSTSVRLNIK